MNILSGALVAACCVDGLNLVPGRRFFFAKSRPVRVKNDKNAQVWDGEGRLRVLCWNVQYCAGIRQHFFYDGGMAVSTPRAEVLETTADIGAVIAETEPDVVLLQEVDRRSRRTGYVDEFKMLGKILERHGLGCRTSASYWRVPYVPHPKHHHLGRVSMHLATYSRYKIESATRLQLPLLRESRLRKLFNLRRAALDVKLTENFSVINTHLSAFSGGDGTLGRQVDALLGLVDPKESSWLLAGDFNCLSPLEDPNLLKEEADLYPKDHTDVQPLYDKCNPAFASSDLLQPTYKPYHAELPDRTIDHLFASPDVRYDKVRVVETTKNDRRFLSDHQPLLVDVTTSSSSSTS